MVVTAPALIQLISELTQLLTFIKIKMLTSLKAILKKHRGPQPEITWAM